MPINSFPSAVKEIISLISSTRSTNSQQRFDINEKVGQIQAKFFDHNSPQCVVESVLVHNNCGSECCCALVLEVWTFTLSSSTEFEVPSLFAPSTDLKSAISSFLPLSQLNIWISNASIDPCILYRRQLTGRLSSVSNSTKHSYEFPICNLGDRVTLSLRVDYLKSEGMPKLSPYCFLGRSTSAGPIRKSSVHNPDLSVLKHKVLKLPAEGPPPKQGKYDETVSSIDPVVHSSNMVEELTNTFKESLGYRARQRTRVNSPKLRFLHPSPIPGAARQRIGMAGTSLRRACPQSLCLLGSFEESALKGRLEPAKVVEGYSLKLVATGTSCSPLSDLPVKVLIFDLNDTKPALGVSSLSMYGRKGCLIPKSGTIQATLIDPRGVAVVIFDMEYDVSDMPPLTQTFIRKRYTLRKVEGIEREKKLLHLLHLRLATDKRGRPALHTDIRFLFTQNNYLGGVTPDYQGVISMNNNLYKLDKEVESPCEPRYSSRK
ncbi:unnamed protein product [Auanema sp. JU1783]|nr:unnamed protein product [Auanema sp. JU1783]